MDAIDKRLLEILTEDARCSATDISKEVNCPTARKWYHREIHRADRPQKDRQIRAGFYHARCGPVFQGR